MQLEKTDHPSKWLHIEFLRFICIWLVMFTHSSTSGFSLYLTKQDSLFFPLYILVPFWVKTAVPIFFMISGALLLKKEEALYSVYKIRIFRFLRIIFIFSLINYIYFYHNLNLDFLGHVANFFTMIYSSHMVTAYYFLYIYVSFLMMLPIWRVLVKNLSDSLFVYLIALNIVFVGCVPIFSLLLFQGTAEMNYFLNPLLAVSEPTFYFLTGYWIEHRISDAQITQKRLICLGMAAGVGTLLSAVMTWYYGVCMGGLTESVSQRFYDSFLFFNTAFLYLLCRYYFGHRTVSTRSRKVWLFLGSVSFGVMLTEEITRHLTSLVLQKLLLLFPYIPFTDAVIWISLAFVVGIIITVILKKIPYIKKLI